MKLFTLLKFKSKNPTKRIEAIYEMGSSEDSFWLKYLLSALNDTETRSSAASALGDLGDPIAIKPLTEILNDDSYEVWYNAAESLKELGWKPSDKDHIWKFQIQSGNWKKIPLDIKMVNFLLDRLTSKPPLKLYVNGILVQTDDIKAKSILSKSGKPFIDHLSNTLKNTDSEWLKEAIVKILGKLKAYNVLEDLVQESDELIVRCTILKLCKDTSKSACDIMLKLINDKRPSIRLFVIKEISHNGDKRAIPILEKVLKDNNKKMVYAATSSLIRLGWEPVKHYKQIISFIEKKDIDSILQFGKEAVPAFLFFAENGFKFPSIHDREFVIELLGNLRLKNAVDPIMISLTKEGISISEAENSIVALGKIGDARAFGILLKHLDSGSVSKSALASLELILKNDTNNISTKDLKYILTLKNVTEDIFTNFRAYKGFDIRKQKLDCSILQDLAKKELQNRNK